MIAAINARINATFIDRNPTRINVIIAIDAINIYAVLECIAI